MSLKDQLKKGLQNHASTEKKSISEDDEMIIQTSIDPADTIFAIESAHKNKNLKVNSGLANEMESAAKKCGMTLKDMATVLIAAGSANPDLVQKFINKYRFKNNKMLFANSELPKIAKSLVDLL